MTEASTAKRFQDKFGETAYHLFFPMPPETTYNTEMQTHHPFAMQVWDSILTWKQPSSIEWSEADPDNTRQENLLSVRKNEDETHTIFAVGNGPAQTCVFKVCGQGKETITKRFADAWLQIFAEVADEYQIADERERLAQAEKFVLTDDVIGIRTGGHLKYREILLSDSGFLLRQDPFLDVPTMANGIELIDNESQDEWNSLVQDGPDFNIEDFWGFPLSHFKDFQRALYDLICVTGDSSRSSGHERIRRREAARKICARTKGCRKIPDFVRMCREIRGRSA